VDACMGGTDLPASHLDHMENPLLMPPTRARTPQASFGSTTTRGAVMAMAALALVMTAIVLPATASPAVASTTTATTTLSASSTDPSAGVPTYWLVASDGGVFAFGGLASLGSMGGQHLNKPIVGMAATADERGYWLDASDGGIFAFGDAGFYGSMGGTPLNQPIVGMASTPDGQGYWLVASDGGIFAFGDAAFYGSMGATTLNRPVVGMASTKDGKGYWMVASDGGIFAFGDASFYGSTGSLTLNRPVVSMAPAAGGKGYWLVASDGGIFAFGDASFYGSEGGADIPRPIVAMGPTPSGHGYWFTDSGGLVYNFGTAGYFGSAPSHLNAPVVGMTIGIGSGTFADPVYPPGATGYDISNWQCGNYPPAPHQIGVVEVAGQSYGAVNPCLAGEATWAGAGLNLYLYLTYGASATPSPSICTTFGAAATACNAGYGAAQYAFNQAATAGVDTSVTWWLDVENGPSWIAGNTTANAAFIQGAVDGLRDEGLANVGIYTSPLTWAGIAGNYQPDLPLWLAWYTGDPQQNCSTGYTYASDHGDELPSGGIWLTQYASGTYDEDYAC